MIPTMITRSLIVDDEPLARKRIASLLKELPDVSLVGEGRSGHEAIQLIQATRPDLVFLDIQMPEIGGWGREDAGDHFYHGLRPVCSQGI